MVIGFIIIFILLLALIELKMGLFKIAMVVKLREAMEVVEKTFDSFYESLGPAIKNVLHEFLGTEELEVLDELDDVKLFVKVHWDQEAHKELFDFSLQEKLGVVGLEIWTTLEAPEGYIEAEVDLDSEDYYDTMLVPEVTLLYVCGKPGSEEQQDQNSAYWVWPAQLGFLMELKEGLEEDGEINL